MSAANKSRSLAMQVCHALFRHKKKAFIAFAGILAAMIAALMFLPRTYVSEAQLFVRLGRESVGLDPTATTGQTMGVLDTRETEINSVLELLRNRGMAEKVVDQLGPDVVLGKGDPNQSPGMLSRATNTLVDLYRKIDPISEHERAVLQIQRNLTIFSSKNSTVIGISYTARSPELAQQVVSTLLEVYQQEHSRLHRTAGSFNFFEQQADLLQGQLREANEALRNAKNDSGLVSIEGQRQLLEEQMGSVETEILQAEHVAAAATARSRSRTAALAALPERLVSSQTEGVENAASDQMRKALYDLELRQAELKSRYTDLHPDVQSITRQVEEARVIIAEQEKSRTHVTETLHPVREPVMIELTKDESDAAAATALLSVLRKQQGEVLAKLKSLNDHELTIAEAQRKVDQLTLAYRSYLEKREQARVDQALATDHISNVNIVQKASFIGKPISPNKALVLVLGFVMAVCGAVAVAIGTEYLDTTLQSPADVEETLELPVMITIPQTMRHRIMAN